MAHIHTVRRGECLASIALQNGTTVGTLWDHAQNAPLRAQRRSPYVLAEGDHVFVPDRVPAVAQCATARLHTFRRKGVPELFRLQLIGPQGPRKHLAYAFVVDGLERTGTTDGEGWIEEPIPPDAHVAQIELGEERLEVFRVRLGGLDPEDSERGARQRLLAARLLPTLDASAEIYQYALLRFQGEHGLEATGALDADTAAALRALHGS